VLRMTLRIAVAGLLGLACAWGAEPSRIRTERTPVAGGAALITWFERLPGGGELPVLAALEDELSAPDPAVHRLRQIWALTYVEPSIGKRMEGAIPFFYKRAGFEGAPVKDSREASKPPHSALDLGAPASGTATRVAMVAARAEVINPAGAIARLTTRSYGGNLSEYRTTHLREALATISSMPPESSETGLPADEFEILLSRLALSSRMFGGLVSDAALPPYYEKYRTQHSETRGHNWELLRQQAEENGLYFQLVDLDSVPESFAMVWVARQDVKEPRRRFNSQFLKIASPFGDERLSRWNGYSEEWTLDGKTANMIPLALYSLDYSGVPLPLVDFRSPAGPKRSEMALRFTDDFTAGVLGWTGVGNLSYLAVKSAWLFVRKRHGGATDRAERRAEFIELRHALGTGGDLDPELRREIEGRIERLDLDPMERTWANEVAGARRQYDALMEYARDPNGLPRLVAADREKEAQALAHGAAARALLRTASIASLGLYRHREESTPAVMEAIAQKRREEWLKRNAPVLLPDEPALVAAAAGE
jgi:hypothetical protein